MVLPLLLSFCLSADARGEAPEPTWVAAAVATAATEVAFGAVGFGLTTGPGGFTSERWAKDSAAALVGVGTGMAVAAILLAAGVFEHSNGRAAELAFCTLLALPWLGGVGGIALAERGTVVPQRAYTAAYLTMAVVGIISTAAAALIATGASHDFNPAAIPLFILAALATVSSGSAAFALAR